MLKLSDIDPRKPESWPVALQIASYLLVAALVLFGWYRVKIQDDLMLIDTLQTKIQKLETDVEAKWKMAARLDDYKNQLTAIQRILDDLARELPDRKEIPQLIRDISNLGIETGLKLNRFEPKPSIDTGFFVKYPIEVEARASFQSLMSFLRQLTELPRIVNVTALEIAIDGEDWWRKSDDGNLKVTFILETYSYKR